jgi:hypothetical protein
LSDRVIQGVQVEATTLKHRKPAGLQVDRDCDGPVTGAGQVPGGSEEVPDVAHTSGKHRQVGGHPHRVTGGGRLSEVEVERCGSYRRLGGGWVAAAKRFLGSGELGCVSEVIAIR